MDLKIILFSDIYLILLIKTNNNLVQAKLINFMQRILDCGRTEGCFNDYKWLLFFFNACVHDFDQKECLDLKHQGINSSKLYVKISIVYKLKSTDF